MSTILKATIEQARRVNAEAFKHIAIAQEQPDLDACQRYLEQHFLGAKSWFVYRGGSHVALHRHTASGSVMGQRIAIIEERSPSRLAPHGPVGVLAS